MTAELRNGDVLKVFHALAEKVAAEFRRTGNPCSRRILCSFEKYRPEGQQWLGSSHSAVGRYTESRRGYCSHWTLKKLHHETQCISAAQRHQHPSTC